MEKTLSDLIDLYHLKSFITTTPLDTNIFLGCDSQRIKRKVVKKLRSHGELYNLPKRKEKRLYVRYTMVIVVYRKNELARIFGYSDIKEGIVDERISRPFNRLWIEVEKVVEMYQALKDVL